MMPTPADVAAFLGRSGDAATVALAETHLPIVTAMVKAYTRDRGFTADEPGDDLAAVIVSATARALSNPEQTVSVDLGTFSIRPGVFNGWTLPELAILHRYRRRAL
jgi:hypothetical protein